MTTIEKLKKLTLELRKQRSSITSTLQFHIAELDKFGKDKNRETTEEEAIQYVKKAVQKLKENQYSDQKEIEILESLLPQMVSKDEIMSYIAEQGIDVSNKGTVMKAVKAKYGPLVDMKMVAQMF